MPKSKPPYTPEFRRRMVELVRSGRQPEELATKFEPSAQSIRNWVVQADRDDGRSTAAGRPRQKRAPGQAGLSALERAVRSRTVAGTWPALSRQRGAKCASWLGGPAGPADARNSPYSSLQPKRNMCAFWWPTWPGA